MTFCMRACVLLLLASILLAQGTAAARSLLQDHSHEHGDHVHDGTIIGDRLEFKDGIDLLELRGLWLGEGDQYPQAVWQIFKDKTSLPDCTNHTNKFNYEHYAPHDDHFVLLSGFDGLVDRTTASHRRTTPTRVLNYTNNILAIYNNKTQAVTCSHWKPYIDLRSGFLKAEVISMNLYSRNATGQRVSTSLSCNVRGDEIPGCYTGQVARSSSNLSTVQASSLASLAPAAGVDIPEGAVLSVSVATYVCRNGECATLAPKFAKGADH